MRIVLIRQYNDRERQSLARVNKKRLLASWPTVRSVFHANVTLTMTIASFPDDEGAIPPVYVGQGGMFRGMRV